MTKEREFLNEPEIIETIGEHGEKILMKLQEIVTVNEQDYALLSIVEDDKMPDDEPEDEVIIMKMVKGDDECTFEIIKTDEEFNMVASAISDDEDDEQQITF